MNTNPKPNHGTIKSQLLALRDDLHVRITKVKKQYNRKPKAAPAKTRQPRQQQQQKEPA